MNHIRVMNQKNDIGYASFVKTYEIFVRSELILSFLESEISD